MRKKVSINPDQLTVSDVWEHYENLRDCTVQMYEQAKQCRLQNSSPCNPRFFGMTAGEIDEFFEKNLEETDRQVCLFLIAAAEAAFRVDFLQRVYDKKRDEISRQFRTIFREKRNNSRLNINLEDDVLNVWVENVPSTKPHFGSFKGALNYRHWLAHGRYWVPKLGRKYDPVGILNIILGSFAEIGLTED